MNQKKPQQNSFLKMLGSKFKEKLAELIANKIISLLVIVLTAILSSSGTYYTIPDFDFNFDFFTLVGISILVGIVTTVFIVWFIKFLLKTLEQADDPVIIRARRNDINELVNLINTGQSGAIVGAFGSERTLLLTYLNDNCEKLYGNQNDRLIFFHSDMSILPKGYKPAQFWEQVLKPLQNEFHHNTESTIFQAYKLCRENGFHNNDLEGLIDQLYENKWRLVLLLDRFERLIDNPLFNCQEFLGGLRRLASKRYPSSLSLIITTHVPIWQLEDDAIELYPTPSPYINFLAGNAIFLGTILEEEIEQLLREDNHNFTNDESRFLKQVSGGHPYLLGKAAVILKKTNDKYAARYSPLRSLLKFFKIHKKPTEKNLIEIAKNTFTHNADETLTMLLRFWPPMLCEALISVAQGLDVSHFRRIVISELENQGFIKEVNGNWQVCSSIFAELLASTTVQEQCRQKQ
jgi:hypothetical protein